MFGVYITQCSFLKAEVYPICYEMYNICPKHAYNGLGLLIDRSCIEHFHDKIENIWHLQHGEMIGRIEFKVSTPAEMMLRLTESVD